MKIKNTPEAKSRFFALYSGQRIRAWINNPGKMYEVGCGKSLVGECISGSFLNLNCISTLSDKDAIEWYLNTRPSYYYDLRAEGWKHEIEIDRHDGERWITSIYKGQISSKRVTAKDLSLKEAMYLIDRGYYVGDGTEIEYGWVKLSNQTNPDQGH